MSERTIYVYDNYNRVTTVIKYMYTAANHISTYNFFFSSRRRHTSSVSAFLLNRSSDLLISCLIWLDLVASLPLIKERILVIILLLHFLSLMLGSVLVLMLPLLVWLTPDLRIKKSLLKCNW